MGWASRRWSEVPATVQSVTLLRADGDEGGADTGRYQMYVRYHYDVNGTRRWGDWKSSPAATPTKAAGLAAVTEGSAIRVYYCPTDPQRSVVERGVTFERLAVCISGVLFALAALATVAVYLGLRR